MRLAAKALARKRFAQQIQERRRDGADCASAR